MLVLHADARRERGALGKMLFRLNRAPQAVGGSFTARFDARSWRFRIIAALDRIRAFGCGISFGNQGQFFRRRAMEGAIPELLRIAKDAIGRYRPIILARSSYRR